MTDFGTELELKYIWIGKYKALENFDFNFCHSGKHTFSYNGSQIHLIDNTPPPLSFGKKVTSITTIVGKNGSGKSSFCEIVLSSVATLQSSSFGANHNFDGIVCYGDTFFIQEDLEIDNIEQLNEAGYEIIRFKDSPFQELRTREWANTFVKDGFIYYSNFLDNRSEQDENNLANISSTWLLKYDRSSPFHLGPSKRHEDTYSGYDFYSSFDRYTIQENYRFLRFILDFPIYSPFVGDHQSIVFDLTYRGNNRFIDYNDHDSTIEILNEYESQILMTIENYDNDVSQKIVAVNRDEFNRSRLHFYKLNLLRVIYDSDKVELDSNLVHQFLYENKIPAFFKPEINELLAVHFELLQSGSYFEEYNPNRFHSWYKNTLEYRFYVLARIWIPFNIENRIKFKRFIELEDIVLNSEKYIERRISNYHLIPHLSTGEASYLALFSRIFDTIRKHKKGYDTRNKLILFIDEAEVGFHPDWSKQLIKKLLDFLNSDFNPYQIQLILTTHSPYLLSDLPKYNVRRFYKDFDSSPQLIHSEEETFGSNIYDLLSDSFFMENGFIGDFAQEKIDRCFNLLEKEEKINQEEKEFIEKIIDIVGEPLIKRQLVQLYDERFKTKIELDFIDEQIARLMKLRKDREND